VSAVEPIVQQRPSAEPVPLERSQVPRDTVALARHLLGKVLVRRFGRRLVTGRIVETEAYLQGDPACHAFRGMTARNRSLFLDVGHAYVYLCYGTSEGILLRALEPLSGIERMRRGRESVRIADIARGPGRLAAALGIDRRHDGIDLFRRGELWIGSDGTEAGPIGESVRIGLTKGADARLRYYLAGSDYLSGTRRLNV